MAEAPRGRLDMRNGTGIKAIPTTFGGIRFRSRLEARWAVFYSIIGVRYFYEYEGFQLPSGWYLPDFWLPDLEVWVEIKASRPTETEERKMSDLASATHHRTYIFSGSIGKGYVDDDEYKNDNAQVFFEMDDTDDFGVPCFCCDYQYRWCLCPWCRRPGIEFNGRGARVCGWERHHGSEEEALAAIQDQGHWRADDKCYTDKDPVLLAAYDAAGSYQFT
jgi:hypothetical protein